MAERVLTIEGLRVSFDTYAGEVQAVRGVTLHVDEGEVLAIVGESGSGKSVSAMSMLKLLDGNGYIESGSIKFDGKELTTLPIHEMQKIRGNEVAMIFQDPMTCMNPTTQVGKQIVESIKLHRHLSSAEAKAEAIRCLKQVRIPNPEERAKQYPHEFSGGMRQRAMIAMALSCNPKLLIADEPTTALDVTIQAQIMELLAELKDKINTAIILITHDLGVVAGIADRVAVMYAGKVMEHASVQELFKNPQHPYTYGLLNSIPDTSGTKDRLYTIRGMVPNLLNLPQGCRFCPRCDKAMKICTMREPELQTTADGHEVRCFLFDKEVMKNA